MNSLYKIPTNPQDKKQLQRKDKSEKLKSQIKMKIDFSESTQNKGAQVNKLIKQAEENIDVTSLANKDLSTQEENFKKKLEEKRKKRLLSTSDMTEQIETMKNRRGTTMVQQGNRSFIIDDNPNDINFQVDNDGKSPNLSFNANNVNDEININANILDCLDNSFEKLNDDFDDKTSLNTLNIDKSKNKSKFIIPKQKLMFDELKSNMNNFLNDFNYCFYDQIFKEVFDGIKLIMEEKHNKILEISKNYNNQIKEYEFLLSSGNIYLYMLR